MGCSHAISPNPEEKSFLRLWIDRIIVSPLIILPTIWYYPILIWILALGAVHADTRVTFSRFGSPLQLKCCWGLSHRCQVQSRSCVLHTGYVPVSLDQCLCQAERASCWHRLTAQKDLVGRQSAGSRTRLESLRVWSLLANGGLWHRTREGFLVWDYVVWESAMLFSTNWPGLGGCWMRDGWVQFAEFGRRQNRWKKLMFLSRVLFDAGHADRGGNLQLKGMSEACLNSTEDVKCSIRYAQGNKFTWTGGRPRGSGELGYRMLAVGRSCKNNVDEEWEVSMVWLLEMRRRPELNRWGEWKLHNSEQSDNHLETNSLLWICTLICHPGLQDSDYENYWVWCLFRAK